MVRSGADPSAHDAKPQEEPLCPPEPHEEQGALPPVPQTEQPRSHSPFVWPCAIPGRSQRPLGVVFLVNYVLTSVDAALTPRSLGVEVGFRLPTPSGGLRDISASSCTTRHDIASYGYSASYFFIFPRAEPPLCGPGLARKRDPRPYQAMSSCRGH